MNDDPVAAILFVISIPALIVSLIWAINAEVAKRRGR
jgi:uncharacterized membrane protein YtjA (UPF0391 family)